MIYRGDIRWYRFGVPDKIRPVLVVGRDNTLPALNKIPVLPFSTKIRGLPWEVMLTPDDGLPSICVLKPEWVQVVERRLMGPWIASLPSHRWGDVKVALLQALGFDF